MTIYRLTVEPIGYRGYSLFLPFDARNHGYEPMKVCPVCGIPKRSHRKQTVRLAYQGGKCADFYTYVGPMLCTQDVAAELREHFVEIESRPVEITGPIPFPCSPITELWPRKNILRFHPDSDIKVRSVCHVCGGFLTEIGWMEDELTYGDEQGEMAYRMAEIPGSRGIKLYAADFDGDQIVMFNENFPICTEVLKTFIESKGWTNVAFIKAGVLV